ncbi:MAG: hypothetical protein K8I00_01395 [Candidatus Omnitrophica bacterium]|nr:hypothetical protein [Candidatus Omnitrophota bacterium]
MFHQKKEIVIGRKFSLPAIILCLSVLNVTGASAGEQALAEKLRGTWVLDTSRTLTYAKTSPKYTEKDASRLPGQLKLLRNLMKIEITAQHVITFRGDRSQPLAYRVESSAHNQVVLTGRTRGQDVTLTFMLIDGDAMNMRSSGSDDMDYFIWTRDR